MCQRCESNIFLLKAKFASSGNMGWLVQQAKYSKIISNIQIDSESVIIQPLVGTSVFTFMWVHMHILWTCLICVDMASDLPPLWSDVKISMHFPSRLQILHLPSVPSAHVCQSHLDPAIVCLFFGVLGRLLVHQLLCSCQLVKLLGKVYRRLSEFQPMPSITYLPNMSQTAGHNQPTLTLSKFSMFPSSSIKFGRLFQPIIKNIKTQLSLPIFRPTISWKTIFQSQKKT